MAGSIGQAKVFTEAQLTRVFTEIATRKHPERNLCVVLLSFSLGLRAQEIALLENQLLLDIGDQYAAGFEVSPELTLPARLTKGAELPPQMMKKSIPNPDALDESPFDSL